MKISVKTKPSAKEEKIVEKEGVFSVWVTEPAEKGKANRAVEKALAKHFNVPDWKVTIIAGRTSRNKIAEISE